MLWMFSRFVLHWMSSYIVAMVLIVQLRRQDRDIWQKVLCFFLLEISWNTALKHLFAVPLNPPLVGYAFPSGHTQAACAFWGYAGYLYYKRYANLYSMGMAVLAIGLIAWALVFNNYHSTLDVVGAMFFAVLEIAVFERFLAFWQQKTQRPYTWPVTLLSLCLWGMYPDNTVTIFAFAALAGLSVAQSLRLPHWPHTWCAMSVSFLGVGLFWYVGLHGAQTFALREMFWVGCMHLWLWSGADMVGWCQQRIGPCGQKKSG